MLFCCICVWDKLSFLCDFDESIFELCVVVLVEGWFLICEFIWWVIYFVFWFFELVFVKDCRFFVFKDCCLEVEMFVLLLILLVSLFCFSLFNICWIVWKFGLSSLDIGFLVLLLLFNWVVCLCFNLLMRFVFFGVEGIFLVIMFKGVILLMLFCGCDSLDVLFLLFFFLGVLLDWGSFWVVVGRGGGVVVCCVFTYVLGI